MKRKIAILSTVVLVVFLLIMWGLTGGGGNTSSCERVVGESEHYTEKELEAAMDVVEQSFAAEFNGCYLIELRYDEALSNLYCEDWAAQYGAQEAIVLTSIFDVGASGGDGSLKPNSTYADWQWILTRSAGESWTLQTNGY